MNKLSHETVILDGCRFELFAKNVQIFNEFIKANYKNAERKPDCYDFFLQNLLVGIANNLYICNCSSKKEYTMCGLVTKSGKRERIKYEIQGIYTEACDITDTVIIIDFNY